MLVKDRKESLKKGSYLEEGERVSYQRIEKFMSIAQKRCTPYLSTVSE